VGGGGTGAKYTILTYLHLEEGGKGAPKTVLGEKVRGTNCIRTPLNHVWGNGGPMDERKAPKKRDAVMFRWGEVRGMGTRGGSMGGGKGEKPRFCVDEEVIKEEKGLGGWDLWELCCQEGKGPGQFTRQV